MQTFFNSFHSAKHIRRVNARYNDIIALLSKACGNSSPFNAKTFYKATSYLTTPELKNTVILPRGLDSHSYEIKAGFERDYVTANAIEMPEGGIVTRLVKGRLEVSNGIVCGDTKADILPIFVVTMP